MKGKYKRQRKKPLLERGNTVLPKLLFIAFAITGSTLIWIIKSYDTSMLFTILVPVTFIFIYCGLAWKTALFYIREDQIGDNAYYLGFLYTLSSLSYALWRFSEGDNTPEDIIGSFGVALWSTIVGISLRVTFAQMRQDPHDIEKDARAKIAETASQLTTELQKASVSFNTYTRNLQQSVEEAFVNTGQAVNEGLAQSIEKFSSSADNMGQKIETAFEEFSNHTQKLNDASSKTVEALEKLNQRIEQIEAPDNLINQKIEAVFSDVESSSKKMATFAQTQAGSIETIVESTQALQEGIIALNAQITSMREKSAAIGHGAENIDTLSDKISGLSRSLTTLSEGLENLTGRQDDAIQSITKHADSLEQQLERARRYTEETHESLASMTRTLTEKLT